MNCINILHLNLTQSLACQLKRKKKYCMSIHLQMNSCEQTEFPLHYITALNNEYWALKSLPVCLSLPVLCCLCSYCATVRVTRPGQCSGSAQAATLEPFSLHHKFFTNLSKPLEHVTCLDLLQFSCGPLWREKKGSITATSSQQQLS